MTQYDVTMAQNGVTATIHVDKFGAQLVHLDGNVNKPTGEGEILLLLKLERILCTIQTAW